MREGLGEVLDDPDALRALLVRNPIRGWVGEKGTDDVEYFSFRGRGFSTTFCLPGELRVAARDLLAVVVEWRLAEYTDRLGGS